MYEQTREAAIGAAKKITVTDDNVLIVKDPKQRDKSFSTEGNTGVVAGIGPGRFIKDTDDRRRPSFGVGDRVLFSSVIARETAVEGHRFVILQFPDIVGVFKQEQQ